MRLWLLAGLVAVLALVAVAGADLGDARELEDAPDTPVRARRQVEKQRRPRPRPRPKPTWRPGFMVALSKEVDPLRVRREDRKRTPSPSKPCPGCYSPLRKDLLRVRREDRKLTPPPSKPCPGCYSPLTKPDTPVRARRQVEKQRRPRPWRPGSMIPLGKDVSFLRPAKVEVQDSEVRTRREAERRPQPRPRSRSNPLGHSPYNYGYMTLLASPSNGPALPGRGRRAVEGTQPRTLKPKRPRLPCSGCYSPLESLKDNHQQGRVKREGRKPQQARPTRKPTWRPGSGSIIGWSPPEEVKDKLAAPKLPCPSCHGSVAPGQEGRSAEGILSPRPRREDERPMAAKRKAKQRARDGLYCAGCYSSLTLRDQPAPVREEADGASSRD
ncbi:translation initiation factor IF-2 isoform X2 [Chelonia mydas]|uniref:translation initiation factor IF-2 isoform X2 n=1 Tax=Chelonia mydas TaxID=8469 RepID=UPI0018A1C38C|nr:translation initiation factor IF-2 isoform X2 [Chelonia mydas]